MAKDWKKMDQWERNQFSASVGRDFYDVKPARYGRPGETQGESRSWRDVTQDTAKAMGEDYDVREYLRYTGGELPKTDEDIYNLHQAMKKDHKKNSGGAYNSRSDMAGVSQRAFENDRKEFTSSLDKKYASVKDLASLKDELIAQATDKISNAGPVERSDKLQDARDRMATAASDPGSLYGDNKGASDGAKNFLANSKDELNKAANLKPSKSNLNNAASFLS